MKEFVHFGYFSCHHHDRVADLLPNLNCIGKIELEQITPLAPGSSWNITLVLQTGIPSFVGLYLYTRFDPVSASTESL